MTRRMLEILNDVKKKVPKGRRVSNPVIVFFLRVGCNVKTYCRIYRLHAFIHLFSLLIPPISSSVSLHELVTVSEEYNEVPWLHLG